MANFRRSVTLHYAVTHINNIDMFGGQAIGQKQGSQTTFFLNDHLGGLLATMSGAVGGAVHTIILRDAWGKQVYKTGTPSTAYLYTGQRWDEMLGLYDYNARFYDPQLARFLSADTAIPNGANPQAYNRLSYVLNSPANANDPTGHIPVWVIKAGVGAVTDLVFQVAFNYFFNPDVSTIPQALSQVNWVQVAASAGEALVGVSPMERALISAAVAVGANWLNAAANGEGYTFERAFIDFAIGFMSSLTGDILFDLVAKLGREVVEAGLRKMGAGDELVSSLLGAPLSRTVLSNASKSDARAALNKGIDGLTDAQAGKMLRKLSKGRADSVSIELLENGNARMISERAGSDGFQRLIYEYDADGTLVGFIQEAYDSAGNLVHRHDKLTDTILYDASQ